ncbi:MAG: hypothetical protein KTR31_12860 [Myxococcales bacterium]|nr:hypothetical protein [Myxococcales bacterium]
MFWFIPMAQATEPPRELLTWVQPEYGQDAVWCSADLRVEPEGRATIVDVWIHGGRKDQVEIQVGEAVAKTELPELLKDGRTPTRDELFTLVNRGLNKAGAYIEAVDKECKALTPMLSAAVRRWRYAPSDEVTREQVSFVHVPADPHPIRQRTAPDWASAEEARIGRQCFVHVWVDEAGTLIRSEVHDCPEQAHAAVEASLSSWGFVAGDQGWSRAFALTLRESSPAPLSSFLPFVGAGLADVPPHCMVKLHVNKRGRSEVLSVTGCSDGLAQAAANQASSHRFERSDATWSLLLVYMTK